MIQVIITVIILLVASVIGSVLFFGALCAALLAPYEEMEQMNNIINECNQREEKETNA